MIQDRSTLDTDRRASAFMKQGLALMAEGGVTQVTQALVAFDQALALRRSLPVDAAPTGRYGLAACWLNRAEALTCLGGAANLTAAVHAFDEAIALMADLPLADDARYPRRLAIAHQNRGLAFEALGWSPEAAISAFDDALAVLDAGVASGIENRVYLTAVVCANLARACAVSPDRHGARAREAARRALDLVADLEHRDLRAAEAGLAARHALCRVLAADLSRPGSGDAAVPADARAIPAAVHEGTDLVEDGLALVSLWERQGADGFRDLAFDLFRFGARLYERYQPQFLDEFVVEHAAAGLAVSAGAGRRA